MDALENCSAQGGNGERIVSGWRLMVVKAEEGN
jgi:hypothetical protein